MMQQQNSPRVTGGLLDEMRETRRLGGGGGGGNSTRESCFAAGYLSKPEMGDQQMALYARDGIADNMLAYIYETSKDIERVEHQGDVDRFSK